MCIEALAALCRSYCVRNIDFFQWPLHAGFWHQVEFLTGFISSCWNACVCTGVCVRACATNCVEVGDNGYERLNSMMLADYKPSFNWAVKIGQAFLCSDFIESSCTCQSPSLGGPQSSMDLCVLSCTCVSVVPGVARCFRSTARSAGDQTFLR